MKNNTSNLRDLHNDAFIKISGQYDQIQDVVSAPFSAPTRAYCKDRLPGKTVLDVGNGGVSKEKLLGKELARQVKSFVAVDQCFEMLNREHITGEVKVVADAFALPFPDKSFDYVLLNGMIHHLGFKTTAENRKKVTALFKELQRVCRNDVIVTEIFVSPLLEWGEKIAAFFLGYMHTFVLSEKTVDSIFKSLGTKKQNAQSKTLTQLSRWNYWYLIFLEYPWFKLPAFLNPFQWAFFTVPTPPSTVEQKDGDETVYCCPTCKGTLKKDPTSFNCAQCSVSYPVKNGVAVFLCDAS